ncbi:protein kinase [Microbacterium sp. NPDC028030]|uniref:serine/threonine-protein kinase n=1 Tax=Microbacterium sp. NPDC028030 TaxID=3155124 RepID=UPI0033C9105D
MWTEDAAPTEALLDARYRLAEVVGEGGMATVYRAEDVLLGRTVAVKVIRREPRSVMGSADRAHTEKALLASLNHPCLVTLLDAKLDPGSEQYLVMEYVAGPAMSTRMARSPIPPVEVAHIGADIAEALHAVHAAGIVHRDVKPSNVLLVPPSSDGDRWHAKLADFGIACTLDASRVTSPGFVLGTVAYMAPEQLRNADLRPSLDIYALGLVLLEALTGQPGFPSGLGVQSALARLHISPDIPETLGPDWVGLLTRMTALDPDARPHALDAARSIRALAAAPPPRIAAAAPPSAEPARTRPLPAVDAQTLEHSTRRLRRRPDARRRRRLGLVGAAVAAVVVGSTASVAWMTSGSAEPEIARTAATAPPRQDPVAVPAEQSEPTTQEPTAVTPVSSNDDSRTPGADKGSRNKDQPGKDDPGKGNPGKGSPGKGKPGSENSGAGKPGEDSDE